MKAQIINHCGEADVFEYVELPKPQIDDNSVLVRVKAVSVNPIDCKIRKGIVPALCPSFPAILHGDMAGIVESVGKKVENFNVGDLVYGCVGGVASLPGALSQYTTADPKLLAIMPKNLSFTEAAALPLVTHTAWEALYERTTIHPNEHVLIHGGAGGVGHIAIQLAKLKGAKVYTTVSSEEKAQIVRKLGADEVIFYRQEKPEEYLKRLTDNRGFDVVFDTVGGETLIHSFAVAKLNGTVISISTRGSYDLSLMHAKGLSLHVVFMLIPLIYNLNREKYGQRLKEVAKLVESEDIRPLIHPVSFELQSITKAHQLLESGKAIGKVVVDVP